MRFPRIINSLIDSDLYKFTMMAAIAHHFPRSKVRHQFILRSKVVFPDGFGVELREQIMAMCSLRLQPLERAYMEQACWYLPPTFFDLLSAYQFNQAEVGVVQNGGELIIDIEGYWYRTVLWEVPLMALISELYFLMTHPEGIANKRHELEKVNLGKMERFVKAGAKVAEFGTRRRYSFENQFNVCKDFKSFYGADGVFVGTSNPYIAMELGIPVLGTHAHEWVSGIAALKGYTHANKEMMDLWSSVYEGDLGTALTDTFGTDAFLRDFTTKYAKLFDSVRHDSGDPFEYTDKIVAHYKKLRIDPMSKTIIFSNALTTDLALEIDAYCRGKIKCVPAIGTHFTNDVGVQPLNIVIKLVMIDGLPCIKLSDDAGKSIGDSDTVKFVKWHLKIPDPVPQRVTVSASGEYHVNKS